MKRFSIIIPAYNSSDYIEACLQSILNQTFSDWECIVVDDGSTDDSLAKIQKFIDLDSRFKVYHQENAGVSSARNNGIDKASGEIITFCDSDDELKFNALEIADSHLKEEIDFMEFVPQILEIDENIKKSEIKKEAVYTTLFYLTNYLFTFEDDFYHGYLHSKFFRNKIIHEKKLRFNEEIKYNEDRLFIFQYLIGLNEHKVYYSTLNIYKYIIRETGAMSRIYDASNYKNFQSDLDAFILMYSIACKECNDKILIEQIKRGILNSGQMNKQLILEFSKEKKLELRALHSKTSDIISPIYRMKIIAQILLKKFKTCLNNEKH